MNTSTQPYKGARDFYPSDKRMQKWLLTKWSEVCERYGYEAYDAPMLEETSLYQMKGSDEIISEQTYTFLDRGERSVTIRTEMTPSVSRMVAAKRQELAYPLRWYSIPELWRYERPQRGRSRQFWQLNVDMFGVATLAAEHEMVCIVDAIMQSVGAKRSYYQIKLNSRKFMDYVLNDYLQLDEVECATVRRLRSKNAQEKSVRVLMLVEYALRFSAEAISSVASSSALRTTSNLIGSIIVESRAARYAKDSSKCAARSDARSAFWFRSRCRRWCSGCGRSAGSYCSISRRADGAPP